MNERRSLVVAVCLGILAVAVHVPALSGDFVYDDSAYVVENPIFSSWHTLPSLLWHSSHQHLGLAGHWRPVAFFSWGLDMLTWGRGADGPRAWPFHLTNLVLHGLTTALLAVLLERLAGASLGRSAAALFAVHPVHVEAVAWITGRSEILMLLFTILALLALGMRSVPRRLIAVAALSLLAYGSKESAFVLPAYLALAGFVRKRAGRELWGPVVVSFATLGPFLLWRTYLLAGKPAIPYFFIERTFFERVPIALAVAGTYARILLWPFPLTVKYYWPGGQPPLDAMLVGALVVGLAAAALAFRRLRFAGVSLAIVLLGVLPVSHLHKLAELVAERLVYAASVGFCLLVAWLLGVLGRTSSLVGRSALAGLVLVYGVLSASQCTVWRDDVTLFENAIAHAPESVLMHRNLSDAYALRRDFEAAAREWDAALRLDPADLECRYNLAVYFLRRGDVQAAKRTLVSRETWNDDRMGARGRALWDWLAH